MQRLAELSEPFHSLRLLQSDGRSRLLWISRMVELLGDWIFLVALVVSVYRITGEAAAVALVIFARVLPRGFVLTCCRSLVRRLDRRWLVIFALLKVPLVAALVFASGTNDLVWVAGVVLVLAGLDTLGAATRAVILPRVIPINQLCHASTLNAVIERMAFVAGPLLGALIIHLWTTELALILAAVMLGSAGVLIWLQPRRYAGRDVERESAPSMAARPSYGFPRVSLNDQPLVALMAGAMFATAVVAVSLKVAMVEIATGPLGYADTSIGLLLGLVGIGTLAGPVSVPRLLGRLPLPLVVTGSTIALVLGMAIISRTGSLAVTGVVLIGIGVLSITNDMVTATATRRLLPEHRLDGTGWMLALAVVAGQILAAAALAISAWFWSVTSVIMAVSAVCAIAMAALFLQCGGREVVAAARSLRRA